MVTSSHTYYGLYSLGESEEVGGSLDPEKSSTSLQQSSTVTANKRNLNAGSSGVRSVQELKWDHRVNFVGRAVQDPLLHICEICSLPVLIYGRMVSGEALPGLPTRFYP